MKNYCKTFKTYLEDLGKRRLSPGGGSAVCLAFCLGVSLIEKSLNHSNPVKSKKQIVALKSLRKKIHPYIDKDGYIFEKIIGSKGKTRVSFINKSEKIIVNLAKSCQQVFSLAKEVESGIKKGIISDFYIGLGLVKTALRGCILNLEANSKMFGSKSKQLVTFKKVLKKWQKY